MDDLKGHEAQSFTVPKKHIVNRIDPLMRFLKSARATVALISPLVDA